VNAASEEKAKFSEARKKAVTKVSNTLKKLDDHSKAALDKELANPTTEGDSDGGDDASDA
jgi:hypothetical protein